jgi:uncharacterized protein YecT (DUF1311 family)
VVLALLLCFAKVTHAVAIDDWCSRATKASNLFICSDPELRQQAIARNKFFEAARAKLSSEAYKTLAEDESRWIKSYTEKCGVSVDSPLPPSLLIPQSVIDCYRLESRARMAYLKRQFDRELAKDMLVRAGIPRAEVEAQDAWEICTETAVDRFADQPEPARTVAEAAMATCTTEKIKYMLATGMNPAYSSAVEQATMPQLLARVMAVRAARSKLRKENPEARPGNH